MEVVKELCQVLAQQIENLNHLFEAAGQLTQALVKNDISRINAYVQDQEQLVMRAESLERKRDEQQSQLEEQFGVTGKLTLKEVCLMFIDQPDVYEQLVSLSEKLSSLLIRLTETRKTNELLLKQATSYNNMCLGMFGIFKNRKTSTYQMGGKLVASNEGFSAMDRRV